MNTSKPLIGITPRGITLQNPNRPGGFCESAYVEAISLAGGIPVVLPLTNSKDILRNYISVCRGLLFTGGGDVAERHYGKVLTKSERRSLSGVDLLRDEMEIYLIRKAVAAHLPVLGICRGAQIMNIAFGGTLIPDIPNHQHPNPFATAHKIQWLRRGLLWKALKGCSRVNTSHHQAIARLANGFHVAAQAPDGIVEAIEMSRADFVCGVQFHPERLVRTTPQFLRLFKVFVAKAKKNRRSL